MTHDLVKAARFELETRERHYPALVASGKMGADEATIDFQAWHCILGFVETGSFQSIGAGGVREDTFVSWPHAVAAADRAVVSTREALALARAEPDTAKAARLDDRLQALRLIAARVERQRTVIDSINLAFDERRRQQSAQAA